MPFRCELMSRLTAGIVALADFGRAPELSADWSAEQSPVEANSSAVKSTLIGGGAPGPRRSGCGAPLVWRSRTLLRNRCPISLSDRLLELSSGIGGRLSMAGVATIYVKIRFKILRRRCRARRTDWFRRARCAGR